MKRFLSLLLAFTLVLTYALQLPVVANAAEDPENDDGKTSLSTELFFSEDLTEQKNQEDVLENEQATQLVTEASATNQTVIIEGNCGENLTYNLSNDNVLTISGTGEMVDYVTASDAPWNSQRETIQKIIIEDGVTSIGARAFYNCTALAEIDVSNSVLTIGSYAFFGCVALTHVTLPDSIINLNDSAFRGCSALSLLICQSNAPALGKYVFNDTNTALTVKYYENCTGYDVTPWINYVCVPMHVGQWIVDQEATCTTDGIMHIDCIYCNATFTDSIEGGHRFADGYCTVCQELQIIGSGQCGDNVYWKLDGTGELTIYGSGKMTNYQNTFSGLVKDPPWEEYWSFINRAVIENGVTSIGVSAFSYCTQMESVVIPDSVTRIEDYAFKQCKKLSTITIPQSVCFIGMDCFWGCVSLTGVYITDIAAWCNVDFDGDFYGYCNPVHYAGLLYLNNQLITHIEIPAGVTQVNDCTFSGCTSLISITLPDSVVKIGSNAFEDCVNLVSIDVPEGVSEIGEWAFSNCSALQICKIPEGLTVINRCVFENCISLKEVAIPESVVEIRGYAFRGCSNITNINIPDSVSEIGPGILADCTNLTLLKVPFVGRNINGDSIAETKWFPLGSFFGSTSNSDCYCASQYIYDPETGTASSQNYYIPYKLKTVVVTRGDIRYGAFYNCKYLTGITLPTDISCIGSLAFYGCSSLKSITIPNNMTSIGDYAFQYCDGLTHVAFAGTQSQWNSISVGSNNTRLTDATRHYETVFYEKVTCVEYGLYCPVCQQYLSVTTIEGASHTYTDGSDISCNNCDFSRTATGISVSRMPDKLGFVLFEELDVAGGKLQITFDDGSTGEIPMTADMISGFDNTLVGTQTLTVNYEDFSATYVIEIGATVPDSVEIYTLPTKCYYTTGEALDLTGLALKAHYGEKVAIITAFDDVAEVDMTTTGIKAVSVTFQGIETVFSVYVHEGKTDVISVDSSLYPESSHNYSNNLSETKTFTYPGAVFLTITFNSQTSVESNYDYIYIYDGNGTQRAKYTGTTAASKTLTITGDTFKVKLTSDSSHVRYGYAFSSIKATTMEILHPAVIDPATATCTQAGLTEGSHCEICGMVLVAQEETPALGHNYEAAFSWNEDHSACTYVLTCSRCADVQTLPCSVAVTDVTQQHTTHCATVEYEGQEYNDTFTCDHALITFKNWDGTQLSSVYYHVGEEITVPSNPTKAADNTYTYTFAGWDKDVVDCAGDATYTATYTSNYIDYTVVFKNWNGDVISTKTYHYGDKVTAPADPTKAADKTYTYTFAGWDREVVDCAGDATYTAKYNADYIDYVVKFVDEDDTVISEKSYHYGDKVTAPADPTKAADKTYTYTFAGWDKEVVDCAGDATYTATYTPDFIDYTVVFKNWNGDVLSTKTYHYGDTAEVPANPTREANNTYTYEFIGWDKTVSKVTGDAVYTAKYAPVYISYTVIFQNHDGTVLNKQFCHFGDSVVAPGNPTRYTDETYTYAFSGWDSEVTKCDGDKVYTATYTPTYRDYIITFINYDGSVISEKTYHYGDTVTPPADPTRESNNTYKYTFSGWNNTVTACTGSKTYTAVYTPEYIDYTITFKNYDGTVIDSKVYHYGDYVVAPTPTGKPADNKYTYDFAGWDSSVVPCNGNKEYVATYTPQYINYTVTFQYEDGTVIKQYTLHYGDSVAVPAAPAVPEAFGDDYEFSGWDKEVTDCQGNVVYTAVFARKYISGDLTGDDKINSLDGLLLMRYLNGWNVNIASSEAMDVNGDGKVNSLDGLILMRYLNGWDITLG